MFRFQNFRFKKTSSLFYTTKLQNTKMTINNILFYIYKWLKKCFKRIFYETFTINISKNKKFIIRIYKKNNCFWKNNLNVQVNETAICSRFLFKCFYNFKDKHPRITLLVEMIKETLKKYN